MKWLSNLNYRRVATLLMLLCCTGTVIAGSFEVNPIRIDLSGNARSAVLSVKNGGDQPVVVQTRIMSWTQENGQDVVAPTKDILVTPPIVTIAPGGEQILRLGMRRAPDTTSELSYRLFLQEVPPPPRADFQGLQVSLRMSLPVFVRPLKGLVKASLRWNLELQGDDGLRLRLDNQGTGHIQISEIALFKPGNDEVVASQALLVYVLPGQSHTWELNTKSVRLKLTDLLHLKVSTDAGAVDTEIDLGNH